MFLTIIPFPHLNKTSRVCRNFDKFADAGNVSGQPDNGLAKKVM